MSRREAAFCVALVALTLIVAASAPAFPQEREVPAEGAAPPAEAAAGEDPTAATDKTVERILREQEQLLSGEFTYDPEGRRDPFLSLYESMNKLSRAERPPGIRGMLVTEIDLDGIIRDGGNGDVAFFTGSDSKGYFLRVGDSVFDGTLIAIDAARGVVTFRQRVDDPRILKPYRDVVMKLVPHEETIQ